jgi:hypothetical protein
MNGMPEGMTTVKGEFLRLGQVRRKISGGNSR